MGYLEKYQEWCSNPYFDDATRAELKALEGVADIIPYSNLFGNKKFSLSIMWLVRMDASMSVA